MAIDGGGARQLLEAIDYRVGRFEVDAYDENMTQLIAFGAKNSAVDLEKIDTSGFLERSVRVVYAAIVDNDFARASTLLRIANRYLDQPRDEDIPREVNRLRGQLSNAQRYYGKASEQLALYREDPDNAEAAGVVGRFLCFIKGDWEAGLPLLAKGGPETLRGLALADLEQPTDYYDMIALGDGWWNLSSQTKTGVFRQSARDRAVFWYEQVYAVIPESLDRMHVKARIDEAEEEHGGSPLELTRQLAKEVNVDLSVSLAAIADVGQRPVDDDD
jgi:hypothetical protein